MTPTVIILYIFKHNDHPHTRSNRFNHTVITNITDLFFVKTAFRTVGRSAQRTALNFVLWGLVGERWRIERRSVFRLSSCHASIKQESGSLIIHIVGSGGSGLYWAIFALTFWSNFHNSIWRRFACWGLSTSVKLSGAFAHAVHLSHDIGSPLTI